MLVTVQVPWCHPPSGLGPIDLMFHGHCSRLIQVAVVLLRNNSVHGNKLFSWNTIKIFQSILEERSEKLKSHSETEIVRARRGC